MSQFIPLSELRGDSRDLCAVVCYKGAWNDNDHKTWGEFLEGTAILRRQIETTDSDKWLLHSEDCWYFLLAFTALLQCKKEVMLTANISPAYLVEIKGNAPFFTDQVFSGDRNLENTFHIPSLISEKKETYTPAEIPLINTEEAYVVFWTSGTTGKPKLIKQCLREFETDNQNILSKWGEEFYSRKVCSTVNQHHIYGFLFSIFLPFTSGIPFRREMIHVPEELEKLSDIEYFIITVPAFLKRAVEVETPLSLRLKSPCILASGGFLFPDIAQKTFEVFGVWPLEMYGSTETSGVAWRQQSAGPVWIPFGNAELWVNEDSCLVVRSAYIQDPSGIFETADLVKMLPDGRFILMGRLDSVVKIEGKRISLPEVETRISESGLVSDVYVIALEDVRQYLAAALVFNLQGKEKFVNLEKNEINKFWREYLLKYFENIVIPKRWRYLESLPVDAQGKKKKEDIEILFAEESQN
jgi:acyl-coenzyme A synthetase/AMP-(fatty) acid ligase